MNEDEQDAGAGRRAPRVKIPQKVHDIWVYQIIPMLHNAELDQGKSGGRTDDAAGTNMPIDP